MVTISTNAMFLEDFDDDLILLLDELSLTSFYTWGLRDYMQS